MYGDIYLSSNFGEVNDSKWGKAYPFLTKGRAFLASITKILVDSIKYAVDKITI